MSKKSGWTLDTLRLHLTSQVEALDQRMAQRADLGDRAVSAALAAAKEAVAVAEVQAQRWREQANEWRGSMNDRERLFATKDTVDARFAALSKEVDELRSFRDTSAGRGAGFEKSWGIAIALVTLALLIVGAVVTIIATRPK